MPRPTAMTPVFRRKIRYGTVNVGAMIGPPIVTATINQAGGQDDPTSDLPILFDVVFSEPVTGFTSGDLVLSGTATPTAASVSGSGATYTVSVTAVSDVGTVIVSIPGGVAASIATGVLNSAATSSDNEVTYVVYPAEFVFGAGEHGINTSLIASNHITFPVDPGWYPGDYAIVHARNTNGGTLSLPSWLTRLDGGGATDNPVVAGGFIADGLEFESVYFDISGSGNMMQGITIGYTEGTPAARQQVVGVFRNPSGAGATGTVLESFDDSPANLDVGPINIVDDGMGVLIGSASQTGASTFIMGNATALLVQENNGRVQRVFGAGGPAAGFSFTHDGVNVAALGVNNHFYATALAPGPLGYNPTTTPTFVGAGADATGVGGTGTLNVPLPAGIVANDLLMIVTHANDNAGDGFQPETGWLLLGRYNLHARDTKIFLKRAVGGGSDPTPQLDSYAGNGMSNRQAKCFAYRNVGGVQGMGGAVGLTMTPPANTRVANTMAIATVACDFFQPVGVGTANGYTTRGLLSVSGAGGLGMAEKLISSPGAPSFPVFTQTGGTFASVFLIYLLPA